MRPTPAALGSALLAVGLLACAEITPPPVTPALVVQAHARSVGATATALEHGRQVFMASCQKCHALPSVDEVTVAAWPARLEDMGKRAGLDRGEQEDVTHFVIAAHR